VGFSSRIRFSVKDIKSEVKIIGVGERIEIWDPQVFNTYFNSQAEGYEQIAEQVMGTNI